MRVRKGCSGCQARVRETGLSIKLKKQDQTRAGEALAARGCEVRAATNPRPRWPGVRRRWLQRGVDVLCAAVMRALRRAIAGLVSVPLPAAAPGPPKRVLRAPTLFGSHNSLIVTAAKMADALKVGHRARSFQTGARHLLTAVSVHCRPRAMPHSLPGTTRQPSSSSPRQPSWTPPIMSSTATAALPRCAAGRRLLSLACRCAPPPPARRCRPRPGAPAAACSRPRPRVDLRSRVPAHRRA